MDSKSTNQRASFRYSIPLDGRQAEIHIGKRTYEVIILDESTGGFGVFSSSDNGWVLDQQVVLRTAGGWYEARICTIRRDTWERQPGFRIGLQRLREFDTVEDLPNDSPRKRWFRLSSLLPFDLATLGAALLGALLVGVGALLIFRYGAFDLVGAIRSQKFKAPALPSVVAESPKDKPTHASADASVLPSAEHDSTSIGRAGFDRAARRSAEEVVWAIPNVDTSELKRLVLRTEGPDVFALPKVAAALGLNNLQVDQFQKLSRATAATLDKLRASGLSGSDLDARRQRVLASAREAAQKVLDGTQRARWEVLNEY